MADWPHDPIASMKVDNFEWGTSSSIRDLVTTPQSVVQDANITFRIPIEFHDHPMLDHAHGYFSGRVEKLTPNGWQLLATAARRLGNDNDDGDWYDELVIQIRMTDPIEEYRVSLHCETQDTSDGTDLDSEVHLQAIQGTAAIGDFTLDFVPMSIVYCPPGQDMTASLTQSETYGTRFTLGSGSGMQSQTGVQAKVDVLGLFGEGIGYSSSQSSGNQATSGIEISHFRNTVVTADNQKAIGRAYWGPLGDLFVVLVGPQFAASRRADGTILYSLKTIQQVVILPAWKLLRPDMDPIASQIPAAVRRRLLALDPFLTNLDRFFPDSGADLATAANPYADPSAGNRAELLGRWWLDVGTEMTYAQGESHALFNAQMNETRFESTVTINTSAGIDIEGLTAALGVSSSNTTWVSLQSSKETNASYSKSASCAIVRNQNERDLDGIELYYDKLFSTFMFRRLAASAKPDWTVGPGIIRGIIRNLDGGAQVGLKVSLVGTGRTTHETCTSAGGNYAFHNLMPGKFRLIAGDRETEVVVSEGASWLTPTIASLDRVRRPIDLRTSPIWEVVETLQLPSDVVRKLAAAAARNPDWSTAARRLGIGADALATIKRRAVVTVSKPASAGRSRIARPRKK